MQNNEVPAKYHFVLKVLFKKRELCWMAIAIACLNIINHSSYLIIYFCDLKKSISGRSLFGR